MSPIVILGYHRLECSPNPISTPPRLFADHMRWLARQGYRPLGLEEFEAVLAGRPAGEKRVLITFDDGYECILQHGLPVLREYGFTAVNFLITGFVGSPQHLSWQQVAALEESGVFTTQSHSHTHRDWASVDEMAKDLAASRDCLGRQLALPPEGLRHLAWPWGRCKDGWSAAAVEAGFSHQYLVRPLATTAATPPTALPRVCCDGMSMNRFATTLRVLSSPLGNGLFGLAWKTLKERNRLAA